MSAVSFVFAPQVPWWLLVALAVPSLALVGLSFWRHARGAVWRAVFLALVILFLANPILRREQRQPLDDLVLMVSDRSPSQGLGERPAQLDAAEGELRERLGRLPGVELREVRLDGESREGTKLFTRLQEALAESDRARLGAVIALTDGQAQGRTAAEQTARNHAYAKGRMIGLRLGLHKGLRRGKEAGLTAGRAQGYRSGYAAGVQAGRVQGAAAAAAKPKKHTHN